MKSLVFEQYLIAKGRPRSAAALTADDAWDSDGCSKKGDQELNIPKSRSQESNGVQVKTKLPKNVL